MSDQLPPLPHPWLLSICSGGLLREDAFSADQMHAYARAAQALAYERAARECDRFADELDGVPGAHGAVIAFDAGQRIRALKESK